MGEPLMSTSIITKYANHGCVDETCSCGNADNVTQLRHVAVTTQTMPYSLNMQLLPCRQCHTAYIQNMDMYGAFMNTNT